MAISVTEPLPVRFQETSHPMSNSVTRPVQAFYRASSF
jgi:hypothetical protein